MIALADKTDQELVADVRMLVGELSELRAELKRRDIEFDVFSYGGGERMEAKNFERVTREAL
jgi:hypothetical protein